MLCLGYMKIYIHSFIFKGACLFAVLLLETVALQSSETAPSSYPQGMDEKIVPAESLPYNKTNPPALSLADAYALAVSGLGAGTNQYYCISADCLAPMPSVSNFGNHGVKGWTFQFCCTNGVQKHVLVFFDRATWVQPSPNSNQDGRLF